jgi:hypothetical protein
MPKDWKGTAESFKKTGGFSNHSAHDRGHHDYYATDPRAVRLLLEIERFEGKIWECACGEGHLSDELEDQGYDVKSTDLIDRGYGKVYDFLSTKNNKIINTNIITNPPYSLANAFIEKGLSVIGTGYKMAYFLPIRYLEGKKRREIFEAHPPRKIWISSSRIRCAINGDFDQMEGSAMAYAWFVWQKGYKGKTIIDWFN